MEYVFLTAVYLIGLFITMCLFILLEGQNRPYDYDPRETAFISLFWPLVGVIMFFYLIIRGLILNKE